MPFDREMSWQNNGFYPFTSYNFNERVYLHLQKSAFISTFHICSAHWRHSVSCELQAQPACPSSQNTKGRLQCPAPAPPEHRQGNYRDCRKGSRETRWETTHFDESFAFWSFQRLLSTTKQTKPTRALPTQQQGAPRECWAPPAAAGKQILQ